MEPEQNNTTSYQHNICDTVHILFAAYLPLLFIIIYLLLLFYYQVRAASGQVAVAGAQGGVRQVTAQIARGGQIVRQGGQTSLIVSQQPRQVINYYDY